MQSATTFNWDEIQRAGQVSAGVVLGPEAAGAFHRLKVDGLSTPTTATVLTIERPPIKGPRYMLTG